MRPYEIPLIEGGTTEKQLRQIKSFLYRQAETLNYNLRNSDVVSLWRQTAEALSVASNEEVEEMRRDEFQALRGLIIKSATSIIKNEDSFSAHLAGDYTARSDYGTFTEQGDIFINGNPYTIGQIYKYQAQIVTDVSKYKTDMEGFIKTGVLERESSKPVFGMEIGYNKNTYTVDGTEYINNSPVKIRITPVEIGFYQGDFEVAYLQERAIYFPVAHITGGRIDIGDNFSVDPLGNMKALNADITGTIRAGSGLIGGFEIRGSSANEGNYWPCSLSSILTPDEDSYKYAVFMRGFYNEDGVNYGAIDNTHVVFGLKKIQKTDSDWSDPSNYLYYVNAQGQVYGKHIKAGQFTMSQVAFTDNRIMFGYDNATDTGTAGYDKPIEFYTSGEIKIGTYKYKASNIYVLASGTIRIGQYTDATGVGRENYPATANVVVEASEVFRVGNVDYPVKKIYLLSTSTIFSGVIAPVTNEGADLGHSSFKWNNVYSKYLSVSASGCDVGSSSYGSPINIKTSGNLTLGGLVGNTYEEHSFSTIISYMRASRSLISTNTSNLDTMNKNLSDLITQINSSFTIFTNAINSNMAEINKIKAHLGISQEDKK